MTTTDTAGAQLPPTVRPPSSWRAGPLATLPRVIRRRPASTGDDPVVVVGGVGGSGTRLVAEILRRLGFHTGADCNWQGDNRWFTLLGKLPRWDAEPDPGHDDPAVAVLGVLERAMAGPRRPSPADQTLVGEVADRCATWWAVDRLPDDHPPEWLAARVATLLDPARSLPGRGQRWGWKEPNTHLFLPHLHRYFGERLRYVHVIRDGITMAHSGNQAQVRRWGERFGIAVHGRPPTPVESFDYWLAVNELAVRRGDALPPGRFLLCRFETLCADPRPEVLRILQFVGIDAPRAMVDELATLPKPPPPRGERGTDAAALYGHDRLARLRALGFPP